jgi:rhodanese-related sulfurtransferase
LSIWPVHFAPATIVVGMEKRRTTEDLLRDARARLRRLGPADVAAALERGALVVDTRSLTQRQRHGEIPGSVVIERNVLEWRLDPAGKTRIPEASYDVEVVVVCQEGYSSSLAAASLQQLGIARATDLDGGFLAWRDAGLPVAPGGSQRTATYVDAPHEPGR